MASSLNALEAALDRAESSYVNSSPARKSARYSFDPPSNGSLSLQNLLNILDKLNLLIFSNNKRASGAVNDVDELETMLHNLGFGETMFAGEEQLNADGSELSALIDFLSDNQLNKERAHTRHRRVYTQETDEGLMEFVEEEEVGADRVVDGPEELPGDAPIKAGSNLSLAAKAQVLSRKRSIISREKPRRPVSLYPDAPSRPVKISTNGSGMSVRTCVVGEKQPVLMPSVEAEGAIGFVKPPQPRIAEILASSEVVVKKEGYLRLGRDMRWFRLVPHRLELWRSNDTSHSPLGVISLGFKELSPHGTTSFKITSSLRSDTVVLHCKTANEFAEWLKAIVGVMTDYKAIVISQGYIVPRNSWIGWPLRVYIGSWNVGNAPPAEDLSTWLTEARSCDIVAVGTQECKYSPPDKPPGSSVSEDWFSRIVEHVGNSHVVLFKESLWEIRNIVLIRRPLAGYVQHLEGATVATGIANTLGNKGGVGVRFALFDSTFCFINSHLAAHMESCDSRNADFRQILAHLKFGRSDVDANNLHEYCFWYGDLNYRLEGSREQVLDFIKRGHVRALHTMDQLTRERNEGRAFSGFSEIMPPFRPTYRYDRFVVDANGERIYNEEKLRVPSWCDRVLWRNHPNTPIKIESYHCADTITSSDHSPVFATFSLSARLPHPFLKSLNRRPFSSTKDGGVLCQPEMHWEEIEADLFSSHEPNVYIKFVSPVLSDERKWKTSILMKTTQPTWDLVDSFPVIYDESEYVQSHHVILVFMDDIVGHNRPLGQAIVSLKDACGPNSVRFETDIYYHGSVSGRVVGNVHVTGVRSVAGEISAVTKHFTNFPMKK